MAQDNREETKNIIIHLHANFIRNYAIRRAIEDNSATLVEKNLWRILSNSCLDIAVINWCNLFGAYSESTHWQSCKLRGIIDFENQILNACGISKDDYKSLHHSIKNYRDRAVAHIDLDDWQVNVPFMHNAYKLVCASTDALNQHNALQLNASVEYDNQYKIALALINKAAS